MIANFSVRFAEDAYSCPASMIVIVSMSLEKCTSHILFTVQVYVRQPKQDRYGLGYDPYKHAPEFRGM